MTAARDLLAAINGRGEPVTASDDDGRIEPAALTTWAPIPLDAVLNGDDGETHPSMLARTDGRCLLYPARVHALHAEPEALKSWLALKACAERIAAGEAVLYLDFEDSPASVVQRLLDLGVAPAAIAERFIYIRPDEPLTPAAMHDLDQALSAEPTLAVIDGVTEAYTQLGLNPMDNVDIATWLDLLPRKFARAGVTVLTLDHVVKDRENRGRYAIGGQHKLAGVDVAYSLKVLQPFARGRDGLVSITVQKDRAGRVREFAADGQVALLRAVSGPDGSVRIKLEPPEQSAAGAFRPTLLMERVSRAVEATPGLTKTAIREAVRGKAKQIDLARETLISEGYIEARHDGPQAVRHYSTTPFCMPDDANPVPPSPPRPNPVPGRAETYPVPPSHPLRKGDGGPGSQDSAKNSNPVPVCCCAIDGWPAELTPDGRCERCEGWPRPDHDPTEGS